MISKYSKIIRFSHTNMQYPVTSIHHNTLHLLYSCNAHITHTYATASDAHSIPFSISHMRPFSISHMRQHVMRTGSILCISHTQRPISHFSHKRSHVMSMILCISHTQHHISPSHMRLHMWCQPYPHFPP